jgi:hypothetical protein
MKHDTVTEIKSVTVEMTAQEARALRLLIGSIGHFELDGLGFDDLDPKEKTAFRKLTTEPLWGHLDAALGHEPPTNVSYSTRAREML